ncbi:MAG TPA: EAL domain-containing protein [Sinorhizobium sp.]|nr:EAL domain-containing protein [Sinorhizobium sp.]
MNLGPFNSVIAVVAEAMRQGRIGFALQQVNSVVDLSDVLYSECLGRLVESDGAVRTSGEFIAGLQAARCAPVFDRHLIGLAFDWLADHPARVLGCNISTENIADEENRTVLYDLLSGHSAIASRFVLEFTESSPILTSSVAAELFQSIRALGYRIAVGFGTGHLSPEALLSIPIDIIKIDALSVQQSCDEGERFLRHLVGLASCAAPTVVVEGIETYAQFEAARAAGATHVQGVLLSEPTLPPVYCGWMNPFQEAMAAKSPM